MPKVRGTVLGVLAGLVAACQAAPGAMDRPGVQKLTWFSYLDAADVREGCAPGRPDRYRLVYNAHYAEQVRAYEIAESTLGGGRFEAAAQEGTGISVTFRQVTADNPLASWGWMRAPRQIDTAQMAAIRRALVASGALAPQPAGLRLRSNAFYWIASGCLEGQPFYHAWLYDDGAFQGLAFPNILFALDGTGVAVNPPRRRDPGERTSANTTRRQSSATQRIPYFEVQLDEDGLKGGALL